MLNHGFFLSVGLCVAVLGCAPDGSVRLRGAAAPDRVQGARDLGPVAGDLVLDFVVGLPLRDAPRLHRLLSERPSGGDDVLAPDEFADRFAVSPVEYARLVGWLRAQGLLVVRLSPGRTTVTVRGSAAAVARALGVEVHDYLDAAGSFWAAATPPRFPVELEASVLGVVGLDGAAGWASHLLPPAPASPDDPATGARAQDLETIYNSAAVANPGMGETVAILGAGTPPDPVNDVGRFVSSFQPYHLTSVSGYNQIFLGGPNRDPANEAMAEYIENCLDAEMVLSMAPLATVQHVLVATNSPGLFTDGIAYIVNQLPQAHAVTVSFGSCERGAAGSMPVVDTLLAQAQAEGQQWFFSSGDSGSDGCGDGAGNKVVSAGWPASSPFAVGVGGTTYVAGTGEVAWNDNTASSEAAGGGGPSESYDKPAFQTSTTPADNCRDEPDVAAIAGGHGVYMVALKQSFTVNGTSVAAPIWGGVWALVDQHRGGGGIKDALTKIYAVGNTTAFNDVTKGDNGGPDGKSPGFPAGVAYDLATGWGSPNVANLMTNLP